METRSIPKETHKHTFVSGATSSIRAIMYHLIPACFNRRTGLRFTVGAITHGEYNYRKGLMGNDIQWLIDRFNHIEEHWMKFKESGNKDDDNLGAMAWGIAVIMEAEEKNPELVKAALAHIKSSTGKEK